MNAKYFIDTNIIIYSFDHGEPGKQKKAIHILDEALNGQKGCISYQVVQEFLNVALKKFAVPLTWQDCRDFLHMALEPLCEIHSSIQLYHQALDISERWRYSFYDALIISAALQSSCKILYSEDLQHDQNIHDIRIINPFL
jgi:predicted nucleic acid-binding protein